MPFADSEGCRIHYTLEGSPTKPLLVQVIGSPQVPQLLDRFQVLRVDLRGQGASDAPPSDYTVEQMGRDVVAAVDAVKTGDPLQAGFAARRAVLGDAHVDRAIAATNDLTRDYQDLITRYAWGTVWTRPGLDHRTRRLLVLAMTASLGRWEEFRLHAKAGLEADDIKEVLLMVAIYAGVPAANTGFHILTELRGADSQPAEAT